jgi:hypothetical protein
MDSLEHVGGSAVPAISTAGGDGVARNGASGSVAPLRHASAARLRTIDRLFDILVSVAVKGDPAPSNQTIAEMLSLSVSSGHVADYFCALKREGRIGVVSRSNARTITILVGPHAGAKTAESVTRSALHGERNFVEHRPVKQTEENFTSRKENFALSAAVCQWCEAPLLHNRDQSSCCSRRHFRLWASHGYTVTEKQAEARKAHLAQQPRGCASVEDFIRAGGQIYVEPGPRVSQLARVAVRGGNGRVAPRLGA